MKLAKFLLVFLSISFFGTAQQHTGKVWLETGVTGKIVKDLTYGVDLTTRFGNYGLETFFPQVSFKYKVKKWFRPSIDYRLIGDRKKFDERYQLSHRINLNAEFRHAFNRIYLKTRVRYQFAFGAQNQNYDSEFDQAIRWKIEGMYDVDNFFLSPVVSGELFVNPQYDPKSPYLNKYRFFAGVDSDFDSPHSFSIGYMMDLKMDLPFNKFRHICSLGYTYEIGYKSKKDKK